MGKRIIKVVLWKGCTLGSNQCISVDGMCVRSNQSGGVEGMKSCTVLLMSVLLLLLHE